MFRHTNTLGLSLTFEDLVRFAVRAFRPVNDHPSSVTSILLWNFSPLRRSQPQESTSRYVLSTWFSPRPPPGLSLSLGPGSLQHLAWRRYPHVGPDNAWTWLGSPHWFQRWFEPGQPLQLSLPQWPRFSPGFPAAPRRGVPRPLRSASAVSHDSDGLLLSGPRGVFHPLTPWGFCFPAPRWNRVGTPRTNHAVFEGKITVPEAPSLSRRWNA